MSDHAGSGDDRVTTLMLGEEDGPYYRREAIKI